MNGPLRLLGWCTIVLVVWIAGLTWLAWEPFPLREFTP